MTTKSMRLCGAAILSFVGCSYRLSAQSIAPNDAPSMFPQVWAVATSGPSSTGKEWITVVDATGDSIFREQPLVSTTSLGFTVDGTGMFGENLGNDGSLNYFQANGSLLPNTVGVNSLPATSCIANISAPPTSLLALDVANNYIDTGTAGSTPGMFSISQGASVPMTPIGVTGNPNTGRYAVISQNLPYGVACNNIDTQVSQAGSITFYETSTNSIDSGNTISIGHCPVFGVTSADGQRSFVLNRGDDTVSAINLPSAALDTTINLLPAAGTHAAPVHAEYVARRGKLLVANYENDTISVINVQTDSKGSDGPAFGVIVATVDLWNGNTNHVCPGTSNPCSKHPAAIAALPDGSRAYVAEQGTGQIDVLDLRVNQIVSTLAVNATVGSSLVTYHPRELSIVSNASTNSLFSRVYVGAPDSTSISYIYAGDNTIFVGNLATAAGNLADIHITTSTPSAGTGNGVFSTRLPGAGEPCASPVFAPANLTACLNH